METQADGVSPGYQLFMLVVSLYAIAAFGVQVAMPLQSETDKVLGYMDYAVCALFFADFLHSLWKAPRKLRYLGTWGWLDLLSCIPMVDAARLGRIARVLRILRVLRGLRAAKIVAGTILRHRSRNGVLAALLATFTLIAFCSIAILHAESGPGSNIKTAEDAIWWSLTTITTVGYGDHYPVTGEGRFIASLLMFAGVGLFTTFAGLLAAWFTAPAASEARELALLREEMAALRQMLQARAASQEDKSA